MDTNIFVCQYFVPDFQAMLKRLFKNPLLMCNTFSYVFYMFGVSGFWVFMPKYMETQFYMTASEANQYTGKYKINFHIVNTLVYTANN